MIQNIILNTCQLVLTSIEFVQFSFFQHLIIYLVLLMLTVITFACNTKRFTTAFLVFFFSLFPSLHSWMDWQKFFAYKLSSATLSVCDQNRSCFLGHTGMFSCNFSLLLFAMRATHNKPCVLDSNQHPQHSKKKKNEPETWKKVGRFKSQKREKSSQNI